MIKVSCHITPIFYLLLFLGNYFNAAVANDVIIENVTNSDNPGFTTPRLKITNNLTTAAHLDDDDVTVHTVVDDLNLANNSIEDNYTNKHNNIRGNIKNSSTESIPFNRCNLKSSKSKCVQKVDILVYSATKSDNENNPLQVIKKEADKIIVTCFFTSSSSVQQKKNIKFVVSFGTTAQQQRNGTIEEENCEINEISFNTLIYYLLHNCLDPHFVFYTFIFFLVD